MSQNTESKYTAVERDVLSEGITAIRRNIYNISDEKLISVLEETRIERIESNDNIWDGLISDIETEIRKRKL